MRKLFNLIYAFLEIHMIKVVALALICFAVYEVWFWREFEIIAQVNAMNVPLVVLVVLLVAIPALSGVISVLCAVYLHDRRRQNGLPAAVCQGRQVS